MKTVETRLIEFHRSIGREDEFRAELETRSGIDRALYLAMAYSSRFGEQVLPAEDVVIQLTDIILRINQLRQAFDQSVTKCSECAHLTHSNWPSAQVVEKLNGIDDRLNGLVEFIQRPQNHASFLWADS